MGTLTSFENAVQAFWTEWWIPVAVIASLTLQLILLLTGTARKWSYALKIVAWNAYNGSDYVATLALGGMVQNAIGSRNEIYAVWAPLLLLHLGAPDNISAYALEDNEFWLRHGLLMILQVLAAIFVVINCAKGWHFILLSTCLMVVGPIKYAERTLALRSASKAVIVESVFPIFTYMRLEPVQNLRIKGRSSSGPMSDSLDHYFYIIRGETQWYRMLQDQSNINPDASLRAIELTPNFVTLEDILADPLLSSSPRIRHTCIGFALFKLYRRRFSGIHMYEWQERKTRRFFLNYSGTRPIFGRTNTPELDILSVLSLELQFIFDSIYTKSFHTAFTRLGILFRILTTLLLLASVVMLRSMNTELKQQDLVVKQARLITFLLVVSALFVEIYQLIRMLRSGWIRVWLACAYILLLDKEFQNKPRVLEVWKYKPGRLFITKTLRSFIANCLMMTSINESAARTLEEHWPGLNCVGQYTLIDQSNGALIESEISINIELTSRNQHNYYQLQHVKRRIYDLFLIKRRNQVQFLIDPDLLHQFRIRVVRDVLCLCGRLADLVRETNFHYFQDFIAMWKVLEGRPWRRSFDQYCVYMACNLERSKSSEMVILSWHLATMVCDLMDESSNTADSEERVINMKVDAKILSKYLLYLLVHKAELLPCHAEIGKRTTLDAERALHSTLCNAYRYIIAIGNHQLPSYTASSDIKRIDLKLLIQILVMESPDLRLSDDDSNSSNVVDAEVQQVLLQIYKLQCEYDDQNGCGRTLAINFNKETLRVPQVLWPGLMAGKLLMLGIPNREERWHFIWDFWIEVLASMASLNKSAKHLKQLTMGCEFLTHIWALLGQMGFGKRT